MNAIKERLWIACSQGTLQREVFFSVEAANEWGRAIGEAVTTVPAETSVADFIDAFGAMAEGSMELHHAMIGELAAKPEGWDLIIDALLTHCEDSIAATRAEFHPLWEVRKMFLRALK